MSVANDLYDRDYLRWIEEQSVLLRNGRFEALDAVNLAEEIADMGKSQKRAVDSALTVILIHLLKYRCQPEQRSNSWRATLREHRRRLRRDFADSPSLRRYAETVFVECYQDARALAADETGLPPGAFPRECPFSVEQALNPDFLPD